MLEISFITRKVQMNQSSCLRCSRGREQALVFQEVQSSFKENCRPFLHKALQCTKVLRSIPDNCRAFHQLTNQYTQLCFVKNVFPSREVPKLLTNKSFTSKFLVLSLSNSYRPPLISSPVRSRPFVDSWSAANLLLPHESLGSKNLELLE